ncbi:MAG: TrbI/VirB10 family protein [Lacunisphaera sp.]|nr:TrbI/VirB10 family protein [Lacunisphaera sp.]
MKLKFNPLWFSSSTGQLVMVGLLAAIAVGSVAWHRTRPKPVQPAVAQPAKSGTLPRIFAREGARFIPAAPATPSAPASVAPPVTPPPPPSKPAIPPLTLYAAAATDQTVAKITAPAGRMIPCETVITLESNRLDTPVVGLVTEDVWDHGHLLIPAGAEVHGRATLDRVRERLSAQGNWTVCWRQPRPVEIRLEATALERSADALRDGAAGLQGQVMRSTNDRELKLFAATFLAAATSALQEQRPSAGLLGESALPAATARNATLAGTGAVLRDYAQQLRESIARDGFYLRVPAGKPFTLYVTQPLAVPAFHEN